MTLAQALRNDPFMVGFDRLFDRMHTMNQLAAKQNNYPPYNIVKTGDNHYTVEIAVAGFVREDITITVEDSMLTVKGEKKQADNTADYIHKGIAARDFTRTFNLSDTIEVRGADLANGILQITLENVIPEEKKPRQIAIGKSDTETALLVE